MTINILLGVTGSVAATLTPDLVTSLQEIGEVRVVSTEAARHFFNAEDVSAHVLTDADEWHGEYARGQDILHIELRKWAHVLVIAPLSANTLAKLAAGQCDNLLTSVVRAWEMDKPIVLAPAMNTHMWNHPATGEHLQRLKQWHGRQLRIVDPVEKTLACGDVGVGALAPIRRIRSITHETQWPRIRTA